ncbi:peroxide stress protein YaaA [Frigoribacterium sp. ACAM 257]|uniref:YaaA family protein n=1 Tax=Frigoribacterium sp. ACAM 257 TaxID=2508998 RepID=UPI0011B9A8DF|nr:peroxide stress protein YaaA [Frigoribacterium sp. ACAM 257]TWX40483.1 peroxide stress protein YaaA [Frigoribacterium sp. ACAM 257]
MLFLLPPSETKLDGGSGMSGLDLASLSFPQLGDARRDVRDRLLALSSDREAAMAALKLGPRLAAEVDRNRVVDSSPTLPALARYTGVLFDPVGVDDLDEPGWRWAHRHVVVHSALFGLIRAGDPIPAYRLSHDSRLPEASLRSTWAAPVSSLLAEIVDGGEFVVDLRSEGYVALGPAPRGGSAFVRVVSDATGRRRALNHFNKKSKGLLVRRLVRDRPVLVTLDDLLEWARESRIVLEPMPDGELALVSESVLGADVQATGTGPTR